MDRRPVLRFPRDSMEKFSKASKKADLPPPLGPTRTVNGCRVSLVS